MKKYAFRFVNVGWIAFSMIFKTQNPFHIITY